MEEEERIRILELAFDLVEHRAPKHVQMQEEPAIKEWAKLFDQAYKAIMKTALE